MPHRYGYKRQPRAESRAIIVIKIACIMAGFMAFAYLCAMLDIRIRLYG